ncbi:MAG: 4Fe-4S binding protein [Candidatus Methanomethylophilaceae archaeon]|nr:4Fe-4S binding protein [Candidatus Methanomethylophilaceae archaeon]
MNIIPRISVGLVGLSFNSRYRLASMTRRHPRMGKAVRRIAFEGDDMAVIPKAGTARRRVEVDIGVDDPGDRNVAPTDLVKKVLLRSERIFVMDFCICRRSNGCKDYPESKGCVFIGKGTERIPPEYGRFVSPEEACAYIDECDRLGLVHIIGRNKLDSIWLHTGDHRNLMTICNCCPCCCLWNMVRDIDRDISDTYKRMAGTEVSVDTEGCIGCGICMEGCFVRAISIVNGKCVLDADKCRGCGRCVEGCPTGSISLTYDPSLIDSEAERILSLVNQRRLMSGQSSSGIGSWGRMAARALLSRRHVLPISQS